MSQTILETSRKLLDVFLLDELGIRVNCICPGWVKTPAVQRELVGMTQDERAALGYPTPVLIQHNEIADAVIMFIRDDGAAPFLPILKEVNRNGKRSRNRV